MINLAAALKTIGPARTGIAPVNLLDIQDVNGRLLFFSDRRISAPTAMVADPPPGISLPVPLLPGQQVAWSLPTLAGALAQNRGSASANVSGGEVTVTFGNGFSNPNWAKWGGFQVPSIPAGAVVQAAYVTAFIVANDSGMSQWTLPDTTINLQTDAPYYGQAYWQIWSGGEFWEEAITGCNASVVLWATVGGDTVNKQIAVSSPSIAVYYTVPSGNGSGSDNSGNGLYKPWLLSVPDITFHRSSVTDSGSFVIQNLSGDTLARDVEKLLRASTLEGAKFVYRNYQPDADASWIEVHGKLTIPDGGIGVDTLTLKASSMVSPAEDNTPAYEYSETCQWRWGSAQCGAQGATECGYSYQSCQVPERIFVVLNNYEKNYGETTSNVSTQLINRRRRV